MDEAGESQIPHSSFLFIGVKGRSLLFRDLRIEVGVENVCIAIHMQILGYRYSMSKHILSISEVPVKAGCKLSSHTADDVSV